jgi:amino acid adenylation domain-containing protein
MAKNDIEAILPLSPLQQGLLFHAVAERAHDPYFIQAGFLLEGRLDTERFAEAWQQMTRRHGILRTGFVWENVAQPVQVLRASASLPLSQHDLRALSADERTRAVQQLLVADREASFSLGRAPLMRLMLIRVSDRKTLFYNSHHHLVLDGWSFALLLREAFLAYRALVGGSTLALPPARAYRDYLAWVGKRDVPRAEGYFRQLLEGCAAPTPLPLPARSEPASHGEPHRALPYAEQELLLTEAETHALTAFARSRRVTLNTVLQGAFALLLGRHAGAREVVFGSTVSGRPAELGGADEMVGVLINTLPVRVAIPHDATLETFLSRLQQQNGALREYEWLPLSRVQRLAQLAEGTPLFEAIIVFDSYPEQDVEHAPAELAVLALPRAEPREGAAWLTSGRNNFPLSLMVEPNRALKLVLAYRRSRLAHESAAGLLAQLHALLSSMVEQPDAHLGQLSLLRADERRQLLDQLAPSTTPDVDGCVHARIEAFARQTPDAVALVSEGESLSYAELDRRAEVVAARLLALGVKPEARVGLCLERSLAMVVGLLGVLKAGAAYVPVDPTWPAERQAEIFHDSEVSIVLSVTGQSGTLRSPGRTLLELDDPELGGAPAASTHATKRPRGGAAQRPVPAQLAYLIYTSGSTGRPKGVAVEHRQLLRYVDAVLAQLPLAELESFAWVSTVAADLGHTALFGALCSGRTLHVLPNARTFDPDALAELMSSQHIDALKIVPSHLTALLGAAQPARVLPRRCLILGGESASPALLARVRELAPGCRVVNHYGPTETTVGALTHRLDGALAHGETLPIGRPLASARVYVLSDGLALQPLGAEGELFIGGATLARGYHARPALTAERFLPDPYATEPGARMYRSGDRAQQRADGAFTFLGRFDHQLKVRGNRVELGEIEARLCALPGVREAVVVARGDSAGSTRLVGFVVGDADAESLRAALVALLPDYMVPSKLVLLAALPLTQNGKIDRAALPDDTSELAPKSSFVAPRNEIEQTLADVWREVLGVERVGVHDNFFALGGDSILSLGIIARLRKAGLRVTPKQLFGERTVAGLAALLAQAQAPLPPTTTAARVAPFALSRLAPARLQALQQQHGAALEDVYPASPIQQGMLFHALLSPDSNPYFNQVVLRFTRGLDVALFARAWQHVCARHPMLRTCFVLDDAPEPHQVVRTSVDVPIAERDLRELTSQAQAADRERFLQQDRARGFDFECAPLMRVSIARLSDRAYEVVWSLHHVLLDGWCQARMIKEWFEVYRALQSGTSVVHDDAPGYRDYIAWLAHKDLAQATDFFRTQLRGLSERPSLPAPAAPVASGMREHRLALSVADSARVQAFANTQNVTLNAVVQAAWALALSRQLGSDDVVFGVALAGRPAELASSEAILGVFVNSLPLRLRIRPDTPLSTWLAEIQALNLELCQHAYLPLLEAQAVSELGHGRALFEALLVFQNYPLDEAVERHRDELGIEVEAQEAWTNYPLTAYVVPGRELSFSFAYDAARVAEPWLEGLTRAVHGALLGMIDSPASAVGRLARSADLPIVEPARRYDAEQTLLSWFAQQAHETPDAVAVVAGPDQLTYRALDARSNQLAHTLLQRGIAPESLVGVCTTRGVSLLVSLLAVLKSGAAYVPLDPSYPADRLQHMIADAGLALVLTEQELAPQLPTGRVPLLLLDRERSRIAGQSERAPGIALCADMLAYVIYTSGSTGRPKGVMVRHGGMSSFLAAMRDQLPRRDGLIALATTSLSFDIAVLELFLPLLVGGRVVLADRDEVIDRERLLALLRRTGATMMQATPTAWKLLLTGERPGALAGLTALCGGEALHPELARTLRSCADAVCNLYGPTEATVWSSLHVLEREETSVPLGRPLHNTSLHVLDDQLSPVPDGVAGELFLGGEGVARGYLRRPALTAERFVPNPFTRQPGQRLYRTGDRVRRRADGTLEYLGRIDQQVKLRGYRIELGEIEAALVELPSVRAAAVLVREVDQDAQLVAYVVPADAAGVALDTLRAALATKLPAHMLPTQLVSLAALPQTPNGKLDRRALPAPALCQPVRGEPRGSDTEQQVAAIFAEVLRLPQVALDDSFFALGGHSLLAVQAVSRLRSALQIELPLRCLFDAPTVRQLAAELDRRAPTVSPAALAPLRPVPRTAPLALSFAQQRLWLLAQLHGDASEYNMSAAVQVEGALDADRLQRAFTQLVARHEALRTVFVTLDGEPRQSFTAPQTMPLHRLDLGHVPEAARRAALEHAANEHVARPFSLEQGPLVRLLLVRLAAERAALVLAVHHIVADGWSLQLLIAELAELYAADAAQRPAQLPALPIQYADYAVWQRSYMDHARSAQLAFWRERLAGAPALDLKPDRARASAVDSLSALSARHELMLPATLLAALRALGEREGTTLFMTLLSAFKLALAQRSGQTDILVGTDVANRTRPETEGLIGFFVNLLVLRTDLGAALTFRELLGRVRETALAAYAHQDLPFEEVVDAVRPVRERAKHPLVQSLFVLQNTPVAELQLDGVQLRPLELARETARFDLGVFAEELDDGLLTVWKYRTDLFEPTTIAGLAESFASLVRALVETPDAPIADALASAKRERSRELRGRLRGARGEGARGPVAVAQSLVTTRTFAAEPLPLVLEPSAHGVDLAAWARTERPALEQQLLRHGALLFRGFALPDVAAFEAVAQSLTDQLFGEYGDLPREKSGQRVYGSTPYPEDKMILFHNESSHLPRWPRKQWFFCVRPAPEGGATPLVDCRRLYRELEPGARERLTRLGLLYIRNFTPGFDVRWQDFFQTEQRAVVEARCRAEGMTCAWSQGDKLRVTQRGPAVIDHPHTAERVLFNQVQLHHPDYLEDAVRRSLLALVGEEWLPRNVTYGDGTRIDAATTAALGKAYQECAVRFDWQAGDLILLDNMLVAHARDPFCGPRKIVVAMGEMQLRSALEVSP